MKKELGNKNNRHEIDYSLILQAISSYLVWAEDFFWNNKNEFSIWLIPDGHHIYTGTLKAAGYRLLKPNKTLVLIWEWAVNNKVCVLDKPVDLFMWKKWAVDEKVFSLLRWFDFIDVVQHKFDWIGSELPFVRVISDYKNIVFMEIGDKVSNVKLLNLLSKIFENANIMFVSDLHRDKSMDECKKLDSNILDLDFVKKNKDLFLIELFLRLAEKQNKQPNLLAYLNTWDISTDKDVTNWFGCMVF